MLYKGDVCQLGLPVGDSTMVKGSTYLSWEMLSKSALFSGFVCMRKLTVRTNWPTVAEKPERKALKGYDRS
jgi:hypothetical protein